MKSPGKYFGTTLIGLCLTLVTVSGEPHDNKGNPIIMKK